MYLKNCVCVCAQDIFVGILHIDCFFSCQDELQLSSLAFSTSYLKRINCTECIKVRVAV